MDPEHRDSSPDCDAADLHHGGDDGGARRVLMNVLASDILCIDAHAHLGIVAFRRSVERALAHYDVAIAIGDASLGAGVLGPAPMAPALQSSVPARAARAVALPLEDGARG